MSLNLKTSYDHGKKYGVHHVHAHRSGPVFEVVEEILGIPQSQVQWLWSMGAIYCNQKRLTAQEVFQGNHLRVHKEPRRFPLERLRLPEAIVEETADFLILNKPKGVPVHPTVDNTQENVSTGLSHFFGKTLYVTHRLDVATSGLILFAKNQTYQRYFNDLLAAGKVEKEYQAVAHGKDIPTGHWIHYMMPSPRAPKQVHREPLAGWFQCHLEILDSRNLSGDQCHLHIKLHTGRTHQIRAQLSSEGFPIVGDFAYGSPCRPASGHEEILLHSALLKFDNFVFRSEPVV